MSTSKTEAPMRMRSLLSVPAVRTDFFEKAARGPADALMLDLEDAVFAEHKLGARATAREALDKVDWKQKRVLVRMNALDTEWGFRDLIELGAACPRLDGFMAPKVNSVEELRYLERTLDHLDTERPSDRPLELHIALGLTRVEQILEAARRLCSVSFGVGDYSMSIGAADRLIGGANKDYVILTDGQDGAGRQEHWNDQWHYASARIANACYAHSVTAIDGVYGNFSDADGFRAAARRARTLGYVGKWAIHPTQIALAHEVFSPSAEEVSWAIRVKDALAVAQAAGKGAAQLDGRLIEAATMKVVEQILARAEEKWT
jgi:malyl-CoA/(S)-citramalyl-CoA lyase